MSDKETFLERSSKLSRGDDDGDDNGNNKQLSVSTFSDWRRCFGDRKADDQYRRVDGDTENSCNDAPVSVFRLFRFADRVDLVLMFTTVCLILLRTLCIMANLVFFGRLTGLFAIKSFSGSCHHQHQTSIIYNTNNYICPLGIESIPLNYVQLY